MAALDFRKKLTVALVSVEELCTTEVDRLEKVIYTQSRRVRRVSNGRKDKEVVERFDSNYEVARRIDSNHEVARRVAKSKTVPSLEAPNFSDSSSSDEIEEVPDSKVSGWSKLEPLRKNLRKFSHQCQSNLSQEGQPKRQISKDRCQSNLAQEWQPKRQCSKDREREKDSKQKEKDFTLVLPNVAPGLLVTTMDHSPCPSEASCLSVTPRTLPKSLLAPKRSSLPNPPSNIQNPDALAPDPCSSPASSNLLIPFRRTSRNETGNTSQTSDRTLNMPPNFELLPFWVSRSKPSGMKRSALLQKTFPATFEEILTQGNQSLNLALWVMNPTKWHCIFWDMFSMFLVITDFIVLSIETFDLEPGFTSKLVGWFQRIFWTVTVPRSFFVGYMAKDGSVIMDLKKVARNYARGWLAFDLVTGASDWAEVLLNNMAYGSAVRLLKASRVSRLLRVLRLVRMLKSPALMNELDARIFTERSVLIMGIAKISIIFVWVCHCLACIWYWIGTSMAYGDRSWVLYTQLAEETLPYKYCTSLHWALTQFVGSMSVQPQNTFERGFALVVLIFSFVSSAAFISRITASMTRLHIITSSHDHDLAVLRQYLRNYRVSTKLMTRVMRCAQHALDQQARSTPEEDVELLAIISEPLQVEIRAEIFEPILVVHPYMRKLLRIGKLAFCKICHSGTHLLKLSAGDYLFSTGEVPKVARMYFVMSGQLVYMCRNREDNERWDETSDMGKPNGLTDDRCDADSDCQENPPLESSRSSLRLEERCTISEKMWLSEPALWTTWQHMGDVQATSDCMIVCVDGDTMQDVVSKFKTLAFFTSAYATNFVSFLNQSWDRVRDTTDEADLDDVVNKAMTQVQLALQRGNGSKVGPSNRKTSGQLKNIESTQVQPVPPDAKPQEQNDQLAQGGKGVVPNKTVVTFS